MTAERGLTLVGAGRLAQAIGPALTAAGIPVDCVVARRPEAARALRRRFPAAARPRATSSFQGAASNRLLLLAVSDRAIGEVAQQLAQASGPPGQVALHHAGALGCDVLAPLARRGVAVGVLHPLQCIGPTRLGAEVLAGSFARIEGDPAARAEARRLCAALDWQPLRRRGAWSSEDRAAYHTAAALVSNDLVALFDGGTKLLRQAGLSERQARDGLARLVGGTLTQIEQGGVPAALTGPAVRGDAATVRRHLSTLRGRSGDLAAAHRALSHYLAGLLPDED